MVSKVCVPNAGKGKALVDLLIEHLGIPSRCVGFDLHVEVDKPITLTVRTLVEDDGASIKPGPLDVVPKDFKLMEVDDGVA